jgi:Saxitoxin biosynthesis operon protein SxtJ
VGLFQPNRNPTRQELRWFAGLWCPALGASVGLWLMRHGHPGGARALWAAAAILSIAGVVSPSTIRPVYQALVRVTLPMGWAVSHLVVAAAYFLVITPIGMLMRLRHDPMRRRFESSERSYWIDRKPVDRGRYFRQM